MKLTKPPTKRIVLLLLTISYIFFTYYGMTEDKTVPQEFGTVVYLVLGFYFGFGKGIKTTNKE